MATSNEPDETRHNISESADKVIQELDKPWRDSGLVNHLYHAEELSGPKIADLLGCSTKPVYEQIDETRTVREANKIWQLRQPAQHYVSKDGYVRVGAKIDGEHKTIALHRLVAVSEHGVDSVRGNIVHHKNGIPWDNRPENLELMRQSRHVRVHHETIPLQDKLAMLEFSVNTGMTHAQIADEKNTTRSVVSSVVARAKRGGADV